ncbi:phosphatidylinositol N-acetylglucosaminyltransferase subunit A-like [Clavelina lepadiformis]|uniref:phosphatidylinositol N-acetylglucosaminyltransferase n=1 Tax=Clavelina lepadiformis TaxID=159417 RepID=A0ABP0H0S1_CLALP
MAHNIALVSDFFYPNVGGVENHMFQLAQCLKKRGHKVIIITHAYGKRSGVQFLSGMLKVYYLPLIVFYNQCVLPTIFGAMPVIRTILLAEKITIVHGHSSFSTLAHEGMFHAKSLGIRTVFTDHSLFGFADTSSILTNRLLEWSLADTNCVICVSHTSKENTVLRANLDPGDVFVIPNAVDPTVFIPSTSDNKNNDKIYIVVMSRLVYRKGMDLLATIIPEICNTFDDVDFIIGGDGPKRLLLDEVCEQYQLQDRITFLGSVPHHEVPGVLRRGHIFLNTSLTEAFCMAIVEAACCGLHVISTSVGGIPEVLPEDLVHLAHPNAKSLLSTVIEAVNKLKSGQLLTKEDIHKKVAHLYTWPKVAKRTERVYDAVMNKDQPTVKHRMFKLSKCGPVIGKVFILFLLINELLLKLMDWFQPRRRLHNLMKQKHTN